MNQKVLIISSSIDQGGLGQYIINLLAILSKAGYQCSVLTTHRKGTLIESLPNEVEQFYSLEEKNTLTRYYHLYKTIHDIKPDFIINNYNACVQYILPLLSSCIKCIHVIHSDDYKYYRVASINAHFTTGWIAPTPKVMEQFNQYTKFQYKDKIQIIPHGVPQITEFTNTQIHSPLSLIFIGSIYEHKGIKTLPYIIHRLEKLNIRFHFNIIGEGILTPFLEKQLDDEIKRGIVTLTGQIKSTEVYHYLSKSDIMVFPTHIESFGLVIAEAMINGVVPIVTHLKGITDYIIENKSSGILINEIDDIDNFVKAILQLFNNKQSLENMKKKAHEKASTCFSLETMSKNYIMFLNQY